MKKKALLFLIFVIGFILRVQSNKWGLVFYNVAALPPDVNGTVYTYMPDEKEFLGCYRSLGLSYKKIMGNMPFQFNFQTIKFVLKNFFTGKIYFSPCYPTTSVPITSYLVFFISLPIICLKYIFGFYKIINSNVIFYDALHIGRFITAFFDISVLIVLYKIAKLLSLRTSITYLLLIIFALLPAHIIVSHLLSYNTIALFFELLSFYFLLKYAKSENRKYLIVSAIICGIALASKTTATVLLGVIFITIFLNRYKEFNLKQFVLEIIKIYGLILLVYFFIILYGIISDKTEFIRTLENQYLNLGTSSEVALTYPKSVILKNYFFNTLPVGFSYITYCLIIISVIYLIGSKKFFQDKLIFLIFIYFGIWLVGSAISSLNMLMRLLCLYTLGLLLLSIFLNRINKNHILILISIFILLNLFIDNYILLKFFRSKDIRISSSKWIEENIPPKKNIGIFYPFPYWYSPELLFTDYFWEQNKKYIYITEIDIRDIKNVDYLIFARAEILKYINIKNISMKEFNDYLKKQNFVEIKVFKPNLSLFKYKLRYESQIMASPNIFVSDIFVYKKI